jgi:hypothetical protein
MIDKFLETSNKLNKSIKTFVPSKQKGPVFHCPFYIKNPIDKKHLAYNSTKPLPDCPNVDSYLDQFTTYHKNL